MSDGPKNLLEKGATLLVFSKAFKKKKKKVNGVVCQTWRLALHKWFGRIFFFLRERERESFNLASAPDNSSLSSDQDTN